MDMQNQQRLWLSAESGLNLYFTRYTFRARSILDKGVKNERFPCYCKTIYTRHVIQVCGLAEDIS